MTVDERSRLLELLTSYQLTAVVIAALRTGTLDALGSEDQDRLNDSVIARRAVTPLLRALRGIGLVDRDREGWRLTLAGRLVVTGGPVGLRRIVEKEEVFASLWVRLADTLRSGEPQLAPLAVRAAEDPAGVERFLLALNDLGLAVASDLFAFGVPRRARKLLDVGAGGGWAAIASASLRPRMAVHLLELPAIAPITRGILERELDAGRWRLHHGDARDPRMGLPRRARFDVVLISHLLHDLSDDEARTVLGQAVGLAKPGGTVLVHDVCYTGRRSELAPALFDLMMLVETAAGAVRERAVLRAWMHEAGLVQVRTRHLAWSTLLRGRRPMHEGAA